jgi:cytochrome c peroxidase
MAHFMDSSAFARTGIVACAGALAALMIAGCEGKYGTTQPATPSLDAQLRQTLGNWGAVPIGPVPAQNPALVDLGRALFFDKLLSGNRDVSCASCHSPAMHIGDGLSLAVGTGATVSGTMRSLGSGRQFSPRNAPSLLNEGLGLFYLFWDGRVNEEGGPGGQFKTSTSIPLPAGVANLIAAQAMFPVVNRDEMRGKPGDLDRFGAPNELAQLGDSAFAGVWKGIMTRVLAVPQYVAKFNAAYPGIPTNALGFEHAANAIAAFEVQAFTRTGSPFDHYLARDDGALSTEAKRGALLFFGRARCSQCHSGPLLGGQQFASVAAPQLGPGVGASAPLDAGRGNVVGAGPSQTFWQFFFRVPPLRNVELTAPYMHDGAYPTLEAVVHHYNDVDKALRTYDPTTQLDPSVRSLYHGDATTINTLLNSLDGRLRQPLQLKDDELAQLVTFLKSLTDPSARDLSGIAPASVPSGLPVP